jgi:hypothetical protein
MLRVTAELACPSRSATAVMGVRKGRQVAKSGFKTKGDAEQKAARRTLAAHRTSWT